ncbi:MAG: SBBP repeat-containing protein [Rivularia sp. (in: Bacteria)]|nr:SBBP repeat-containing protein [Rivularia sp. MS3]
MDEFEISTALLTPASDLVNGDPGAKFELNFARGGNDTIYVFDPGSSNNQKENIDFLFGDLFDNSPEEFEIILNIQSSQEGGNPLLILERDIPSVGRDKFVLGDQNQPYYTSNVEDLTGDNALGTDSFAVIYDFSKEEDSIQLNGDKKDYRLVDVNGLQLEGVEQPFFGKALFSVQQEIPDLVAFIVAKPDVELKLDKKDNFIFVGKKPPKKPEEEKKIGQLGTTGIDISFDSTVDPAGNIYLTGSTSGPLQGNSQGFTDAWVAKFNSNGDQLAGQQIGSSAGETAYEIVSDKDGNYYLAGATGGSLVDSKKSADQDAWVAKYDSSGNRLWGRQIGANQTGGFSNSGFGLDVDDAGNVYLSGLAIKENNDRETFDFNVQDDSWIAKFDSNGNQQWFNQIGGPFFDESYDLATDAQGNSYIIGWTQGLVEESDPSRNLLKYDAWIAKYNTDGQQEWVQQFGSADQGLEFAWATDTDSEGNIYVTGWTTGELGTRDKDFKDSESYDIWLAKFSPDGTQQYVKQFGSKGDDGTYLSDMVIDSQDNIFLTGYTNDKLGKGDKDKESFNAWVARFDTQGNNIWTQQIGSKENVDYATGLSVDDSGRLYVNGFTEAFLGTSSNGANGSGIDAWFAQLDVEKGKLQKFIGESKNAVSSANAGVVSVQDVSSSFVTNEALPDGDNRIDLTEGIDTTVSVVDYGKISSSLANIFDPSSSNSLPSALTDAVNSGTIEID